MTKQKKPKTGDVTGWVVIDKYGFIRSDPFWRTRIQARRHAAIWDKSCKLFAPFRVAKIVLAK